MSVSAPVSRPLSPVAPPPPQVAQHHGRTISYRPPTFGDHVSGLSVGIGFSPLRGSDRDDLSTQLEQRSLYGRFADYGGRVIKMFDGLDRFDKTLKLVQAGLDMGIYGLDAEHPDQPMLGKSRSIVSGTRKVAGLTKAVGGAAGVVSHVRTIGALAAGLHSDTRVVPLNATAFYPGKVEKPWMYAKNQNGIRAATSEHNSKYYMGYAKRAEGKDEQRLALARASLGLVGATTYTAAFGVCRPIQFAESVGADLSTHAHETGQQFGLIMFINHVASILKNVLDFIWEHMTFSRTFDPLLAGNKSREVSELKGLWAGNDHSEQAALVRTMQKMEVLHVKNQVFNAVSFVKTSFELVTDVTLFTPLPPPVKIAATAIVAITDFGKMWIGTAA